MQVSELTAGDLVKGVGFTNGLCLVLGVKDWSIMGSKGVMVSFSPLTSRGLLEWWYQAGHIDDSLLSVVIRQGRVICGSID
jgi:hypothetical protein